MKFTVLSTTQDKSKGVIGMDALDPDEVFIFKNINPNQGFHMNGVKFGIDIAFLDQDCGILQIAQLDPETGKIYSPEDTAHAVEASLGYFQNNSLKEGDFFKEVYNRIS